MMVEKSGQSWERVIVPGLLSAVAFLAWYGVASDLRSVKEQTIEAKQLASMSLTQSNAAQLAAAKARPDPFTGTDGQKLREQCFERITSQTDYLKSLINSTSTHLRADLIKAEKEIAMIKRWHEDDMIREKDCIKEREQLRREIEALKSYIKQ